MLVMNIYDIDLRKYLQQNHSKLTWKERIQIITDITLALSRIHAENAIHRDLHSGNILYSQLNEIWYISDLGFCGPADKPLNSIYGNLPYIAPEVIIGREQTFKSDIYSIAMLMWEISSGQPPFSNYEHDYDLAMNIVNGIRPKIVPRTPLEYKNLMKQCWDADPSKRPDKNNNFEMENYTNSSKLFTSKLHQFDDLPKPRNATEAFHSNKSYNNFLIPNNIDDFDKLSSKKNSASSISSKFKDEDEAHNNPNLHSEEQDELELPEGRICF
ncbi:kinase-like domain-containing protein [Rhizophagus diaphanus]|nr:kinase-like domain-containing protein [Rhizophagus diaphanus] [Rhizophagus sp. MUCL 43196]